MRSTLIDDPSEVAHWLLWSVGGAVLNVHKPFFFAQIYTDALEWYFIYYHLQRLNVLKHFVYSIYGTL